MTELEGQLTTALERLSEQSARERQRDAERIEALQQQAAQVEVLRRLFERLDGQVTPLARGYATVAATLREPGR